MITGNFTWFTTFWNLLAVPIQNAEQPITAALQTFVGSWFTLAVGVYLIAILLMAAWAPSEADASLLFRKAFLAGVVWSIATTSAGFSTYVIGGAIGLVNGISNAMVGLFGGVAVTGASAFDGAANNMIAMGVVVMSHVPHYGWVDGFLLGIIVDFYIVVAIVLCAVLFGLYLLSNIILGFLLCVGPIFVAAFMFPFARQFFDGWLRTVVAAILTQVFIVALMSLFISILGAFVTTLKTGLSGGEPSGSIVTEVVHLLVLAVVALLFMFLGLYLTKLAQSIAGGAHAHFSRIPRGNGGGNSGGGGGGGGGNDGGGPSGGSAGGGQATTRPPYSFTRTVGGAS